MKYMIDEFLLYHKRGCLANKGQDCTCGLFIARAEWENIKQKHLEMSEDEKVCFDMGYDCEMNGANTENCNFSLFSSPKKTKAWEAGKEKARQERNDKNI